MTELTSVATARQIADLAEELASLTAEGLPDILIALSRATTHIADFVAAAPAHYPHVAKRAANQLHDAAGALELALNEELNPPDPADDSERLYLAEVERQNAAEVVELLDLPSGRYPELMLGGEL
ncbi:hypothetical protein [Nonomuraea sp. KM90]|uniref:hypothetical protein n=1 Tax=Nonomuraea sp. KM90 TaxID=3457428 RepID=UPI003FCE47F6